MVLYILTEMYFSILACVVYLAY